MSGLSAAIDCPSCQSLTLSPVSLEKVLVYQDPHKADLLALGFREQGPLCLGGSWLSPNSMGL